MFFFLWLISLRIIASRSTYVITNVSITFSWHSNIPVCIHLLYIYIYTHTHTHTHTQTCATSCVCVCVYVCMCVCIYGGHKDLNTTKPLSLFSYIYIFTGLKQMILTFVWIYKMPWIVILRKMNKAWAITVPDFRLYYKIIVLKTWWYRQKTSDSDQWIRIDSPEINPHACGQLIYDKASKSIKLNVSCSIMSNSLWWHEL